MQILITGVGDSFSLLHNPTSFVVRADNFYLGIDCPDMYPRVLRAAAQSSGEEFGDLSKVDHILTTHIHGDHINGLEGLAFYKRFIEKKRLNVIASPDLLEVLWPERLRASMGTLWDGQKFNQLNADDYFRFQSLSWNEATSVGPLQIRTRRTVHHVPTTALLISHAGRTLGYSCDTAFDESLIDFLSDADLILHETNYGPAHSSYAMLAKLPSGIRERMRLIHYPDTFRESESVIPFAREGEILSV